MQNRSNPARRLSVLLALLQLCACADDLTLEPAQAEAASLVVTESVTESGGEAAFMTRVDASNADAWVYFSFASGAEVSPAEPSDSTEWDLAFQRFYILSNGGVSGSGGIAVASIVDAPFASVASAPSDGYSFDQPDSEDEDTVADSAFGAGEGWYTYDTATNRLSPRPIVYVIRTGSGSHYKLTLVDYYDAAGTSGHPSFAWAAL